MPGIPEVLRNPDSRDRGSLTSPVHIEASVTTSEPNPDAYLQKHLAFKGRWGTQLVGNELLVPTEYAPQLEHGGIVTPGLDTTLLLFDHQHWQRMERIIANQLDLDPKKTDLMRHIYGRSETFKTPNKDDQGNISITISDRLIKYARLQKNIPSGIVVVGLIFWAEIYDTSVYSTLEMSPEDVRALAESLV